MAMRWKAIPWALGVVLLAGTLVGANRFLQTDDSKNGPAPKATPTPAHGGVTVLGVVISDPPEMPVGPPAVAGLMIVDKVLVVEGQMVNVGEMLVKFDDALVREKLPQAQAELFAAQQDLAKAEAQKKIHAIKLSGQELLIRNMTANHKEGLDLLKVGKETFEKVLASKRDLTTGKYLTPEEKEAERRENLEIRKSEMLLNELKAKIEGEEKTLEGLKLTPIEQDVLAAQGKIARLTATVTEAQNAIDACIIKARATGIVEQITATPGQTFGPGNRTPVLWIVPTGKRLVRAEVEPEFAPRVAEKEGKKVTITDGNNFSLTYEGTVRRMGTSYQTKRSQLDALAITPTKVLECLIDVTDATPPGKPPLRVGQPVRVSFP
jgi:multidrug resistance efflux pump